MAIRPRSGRTGPESWTIGLAPSIRHTLPALALLLAATLAAGFSPKTAELPEDLGPAEIDVSSYPPEHQKTYRELFLHVYGFLRGGPARALNSPVLEIDPAGEAALRREHPELFAEPGLIEAGPDLWRKEVMRVKNRPPCCGACPVLDMEEAKALWRFLAYDSLRRKTGANAEAWASRRRALIERFNTDHKKGDPSP